MEDDSMIVTIDEVKEAMKKTTEDVLRKRLGGAESAAM